MSFLGYIGMWLGIKKEDSAQERAREIVNRVNKLKEDLLVVISQMKVDIERMVCIGLNLSTNNDGTELTLTKGKCIVKFSLVSSNRPTIDLLVKDFSGNIRSKRIEISRDLNYAPKDLENFKRSVISFINSTQRKAPEIRA